MNGVGAWDSTASSFIHATWRTSLLDRLMPILTDTWTWIIPIFLVVFYTFTTGWKRGSLALCWGILLILASDGSATALKGIFLRPRPYQTAADMGALMARSASSSFPSNHAANAFALATLFRAFYPKMTIVFYALAAVVGFSRIYLGDHYLLDVLAGALLGTALGLLGAMACDWCGRRWGKPKPRPEGQPPTA